MKYALILLAGVGLALVACQSVRPPTPEESAAIEAGGGAVGSFFGPAGTVLGAALGKALTLGLNAISAITAASSALKSPPPA